MAHVTTTAETSVEPFTVSVPQAAIDDLKRRLELTRWPERETVADWTQGVPRDSRQRVSAMSPKEIFCPVKAWAEALWPNLFYWNELDRGGHFAAFEQPALFTEEMRKAFKEPRAYGF